MGSLAEWLQKRSILRTSDDLIPEPIPVRIVEVTDANAARQNLLNTSGQVTEANSTEIAARATDLRTELYRLRSFPEVSTADGATAAAAYAVEFAPYAITADGAGAVTAQDIVAAVASVALDLSIYIIPDTTGTYAIDFEEDPTGTPAATTPDWTGPISLSLVAGYRYGPFRLKCPTDNKPFGHDAAANGSYPNSASLLVWGHYRGV